MSLDLTAIKARLAQIKKGNINWTDTITDDGELWVMFNDNLGYSDIVRFGDMEVTEGIDHSRAEFIAHSAVDIDSMVSEIERITAELALCHESAIDHTDDETHNRCEVEGCTASADYQGWYRVVDFSGNPTGLTQLREVCSEHAPMLIGWKE